MLGKWVTAITPVPEWEQKWNSDLTQQNSQKVKGHITEPALEDAPVLLFYAFSFSQLHHALGRQEASLLDCSQMSTMSDLQKQEDR